MKTLCADFEREFDEKVGCFCSVAVATLKYVRVKDREKKLFGQPGNCLRTSRNRLSCNGYQFNKNKVKIASPFTFVLNC